MKRAWSVLPVAPGGRAGWCVGLVMFALVTAMWWPTLFDGKSLINGDSLVHGLPLLEFFRQFLHGGESPLWVREIFGGHPLFAESQGGFADPLNLLVAWAFPPVLGSNVFHYLCMFIGGFGVLRLCRAFGISVWSSGMAALAVIFSGGWLYLQQNLTVSGVLIWVPWALLAFESWLKKPSVLAAVWLALAGALLIVAGYPQTLHGVAIFAVCSLVTLPFSAEGRRWWRGQGRGALATGILAVVLCLGLSAVQLLPLLELVGESHRNSGIGVIYQNLLAFYARGMLFPLDETTQVPGAASLIVCMLASSVIAARASWRIRGYVFATLVLLFLGVGPATGLFRWIYQWHLIPGLHYFRLMWVYLPVGTVGVAVLAAFATDRLAQWLSAHGDARQWPLGVWLGLLAFLGGWLVILVLAEPSPAAWASTGFALAGLALVGVLAGWRRSPWTAGVLFFVVAAQCASYGVRSIKFGDVAFLQTPSAIDALPGKGIDRGKFLSVSIAASYSLLSSHHPGLERMAHRAVATEMGLSNLLKGDLSLDGALALQLHHRDMLTPVFNDEVNGRGRAAPGSRLIDLLNVRYVTADGPLSAPGFRVAAHDPTGFFVMENTLARPFVQIYTHAVAAPDAESALARLQVMQTPAQLVLEQPWPGVSVPADDPGASSPDQVHVVMESSKPKHYAMRVTAPFACWVFLADANYPGWQAKVDGVRARVWTAQILGKAVHVPAGTHWVSIKFRSRSFEIGLAVSLLTLIGMIALLLRARHARGLRRRKRMSRLSETLVRGNNNFDLIRLIAALAVMLGHSYGLQAMKMEPVLWFTHLESFGSLAVYAFFMISGMLVSASFANQSSVWRFVGLRVLRIWPGAMACAVFIVLAVGPIFSAAPVFAFLSDPQTARWLFHNALLVDPVGGPLPQLFEMNHFRSLVNATVWTLPVELKCYVIVLLAGLLGCIGSRRRTLAVVALVGVVFALFANHPPKYVSLGDFFILPIAYSFYPVPFFLLGMLLYAFRDRVVIDWRPALVLLVAYVLLRHSRFAPILLYPAFAYGVLWLGATPMLRQLVPRHDYSYGIYLYGFVVQQSLSGLHPTMNNYLSLLFAVPITVVLAALSWHLVERPCMASFRRRSARSRDARAAAADVAGP